MMLSQAITLYLNHAKDDARLASSTIYQRRIRLDWLLSRLGDVDCSSITRGQIEKFYRDTTASLRIGSLINCMCAINCLFNWLEEHDHIIKSPVRNMRYPRRPKTLPKIMESSDVVRLLQAPGHDTPLAMRDSAVLALLYGAGLRNSEVCRLPTSDLSLKGHYCQLRGCKWGSDHYSFFPEYTAMELEQYIRYARPELLNPKRKDPKTVILNERGGMCNRNIIGKIVNTYVAKLGMEHITPHTFRHCCATHLVQGGVDISYVQKQLGHLSIQATSVYLHIANAKVKDKVLTMHPLANVGVTEETLAVRAAMQCIDRSGHA